MKSSSAARLQLMIVRSAERRAGGFTIHEPTDAILAQDFAARRGDALARVYDRYAPLLFTIALGVLNDRGAAEDCVHDTLLRIWSGGAGYDPGRGGLKPFLTVAVRNAAISEVRTAQRRRDIEKRLPVQAVEEAFEIPDYLERSQLAAALRALPREQWDALRLAYFEHLTHPEIARRLGIPLGTIKSRISLAIRKLHDVMTAENTL